MVRQSRWPTPWSRSSGAPRCPCVPSHGLGGNNTDNVQDPSHWFQFFGTLSMLGSVVMMPRKSSRALRSPLKWGEGARSHMLDGALARTYINGADGLLHMRYASIASPVETQEGAESRPKVREWKNYAAFNGVSIASELLQRVYDLPGASSAGHMSWTQPARGLSLSVAAWDLLREGGRIEDA